MHPRCVLTRQIFENTVCSGLISADGVSECGVRISLGDESTSENSDIIVFGRPHAFSSVMQLCVARILPTPKPCAASETTTVLSKPRIPRPDDPTPRKPPPTFGGMTRIGLGMKRTSSRSLTMQAEEGVTMEKKRRKKDETIELEVRQSTGKASMPLIKEQSFKVPPLPAARSRAMPNDRGDDASVAVSCSPLETGNKTVSPVLSSYNDRVSDKASSLSRKL